MMRGMHFDQSPFDTPRFHRSTQGDRSIQSLFVELLFRKVRELFEFSVDECLFFSTTPTL